MSDPETTPQAPVSDTPRGPLTSDREISQHLNALLFPSEPEDTNTSVEPATEPEAEAIAESEEQPSEIEAHAETEEVESDESEDAIADEPPQPRKLRVKIEDAEEEVTEEELVKGYQRQSDYTRKTQALAEERKRFEAEELAKVREERQRLAALLPAVEEILKPQTPDWEAIQKERPDEFPALFAQHQLAERQYEAVKAERARVEAQAQKDRADALAKLLETERQRLYEKVPELKDAPNAKALGEYLKGQGFTEEEIAGTTRHELLVMARKAQLYDEAQKVKPKIEQKVESKIKPAKPGASSSTKPKVTDFDRSVSRLRKTGDVNALAEVLNKVLK